MKALFLAALLFFPAIAAAQEPSPPDPRLTAPLIRALYAQLALLEAQLKAAGEDAAAQKATLWQWLIEARPPAPSAEARDK